MRVWTDMDSQCEWSLLPYSQPAFPSEKVRRTKCLRDRLTRRSWKPEVRSTAQIDDISLYLTTLRSMGTLTYAVSKAAGTTLGFD
jgi:hypothetical protein